MGFRFRKSFKIAPGVRINFGKKSTSISVGTKGFRKTYSSSGRITTTVGIPGTGLSYSTSKGGKKRTSQKRTSRKSNYSTIQRGIPQNAHSSLSKKRTYSTKTYRICGIIIQTLAVPIFIIGIVLVFVQPVAGLLATVLAIYLFIMGRRYKRMTGENPVRIFSEQRKAELLNLQKIVMADSPDELICSEAQLTALANEKAKNSYRIMKDSATLLQSSTNPDTFFERLRLFSSHCNTLVALEKYVSFSGASPTDLYNTLIIEKQELIHEFLVRYFTKIDIYATGLKTVKGQLNQYQKFYDSLKPYYSEMDVNNIDYVETKYKAYTRSLEK